MLPKGSRGPVREEDNKSILANTDWKKLWLESGQLSSSGRIDNHLDSSDSTLIDDGECTAHKPPAWSNNYEKKLVHSLVQTHKCDRKSPTLITRC
uniref:Uncharacterized protein n=1 Tax=Anopheles dirus TaxID=7168 RepID=A0A182NJ92_9DIPT